MKKVAIGSMVRNAVDYIPRYINQMSLLLGTVIGTFDADVQWIVAVGESSDNTAQMLEERAAFLMGQVTNLRPKSSRDFFTVDGGPVFGSVDLQERWEHISRVCDSIFDRVGEDVDAMIYVESDLIWDASTMMALLSHLGNSAAQIDAVSPMNFHQPNGHFYDTWGYRKDGVRFNATRPYHPGVNYRMTQIDSAGSCIVMRGEVARTCRFKPAEHGIVGFCMDMQAHGYTHWLDPQLAVHHP